MAAPDGDTLAKDKAVPFVVNYEMVDTDKDGKISQSEFQAACCKGLDLKARRINRERYEGHQAIALTCKRGA